MKQLRIIRKVFNNADPDYPKGEHQIEYDRQYLFREPAKSPMVWPVNARNSLVRLFRATGTVDGWELLLKKKFDKEWYIARVYKVNRLHTAKNLSVCFDSQSIYVFMALCSFYCIGYKEGVINYTSDWFTEQEDKEINERYEDTSKESQRGHDVYEENGKYFCRNCKWGSSNANYAIAHRGVVLATV